MIHHWLRPLVEMPLPLAILLKVTMLLAVAWAAHLPLRQRNPHWRMLLWRGAGMAIVAVPLLAYLTPAIPIAVSAPAVGMTAADSETLFSPEMSDEPLVGASPERPASQANAAAGTVAASPALTERVGDWLGDHWTHLLFTLWAAGIGLLIVRWLIVWARLRRVVGVASEAGQHEQECLHRAARILGCDAAVQLRVAENVAGPLLAGIRKPVILLPRRMTLGAESGELSAILAHELTHLHNRDLPWMGFLRAIAVVCWWHPLTWIMCRAHGQACEEVCDAIAAAHVGDRGIYSRTLARVALAALAPTPALAGVPMARPAEIMRRLSRLQAAPAKGSRPVLRQIVAAGAAGAAVLLALSGLQLVHAATSTTPGVAPARTLHFPKDRSLGTVWIQDANLRREIQTFYHWTGDGVSEQWVELGEARGEVAIPAGQRVKLSIARESYKDLSPLKALSPDDIDELIIGGMGAPREESEERGFFRTDSAGDAIMPHVAHLTGLKALNLSLTYVTGQGLRHIEQMKSLECLDLPLRMNDAGMIHVAKLTGLKRLYFKSNNVTNKGLARIAELRDLEELALSGPQINDAGLVHLKRLPKLSYLIISTNPAKPTFTDAGMVHIKEIRSLRMFYAFRMSTIGDEGLAHLSSLPSLERLNLSFNKKITDAGMAPVARMKSLRQLDISHTGIGDIGAEHLQQLTNLELLELPDGISRPAMVDLLATKPRLRKLWLGSSSSATYGDEVLEQVGKMADLEILNAGGQNVTDAGMVSLSKCRKLKSLGLFNCPITNKGLGEVSKLALLERLSVYDAKLTTSGLGQLNALKNLKYLTLHGIAPDEGFMDFSGLTGLRQLTVGPEYKGGPLRDEDLACLANLPDLEWLQMPWMRGISNKGLAHLAGLAKMERLGVGGEGITDAGLDHLAKMKRLNLLTISGEMTEKGLLKLEQHPKLTYLTFMTPFAISEGAKRKLAARLPTLIMLKTGRDLQHTSPMRAGAAGSGE